VAFEKACEECGHEFTAKKTSARFCGAACRVRANRKLHRQQQTSPEQQEEAPAIPPRGGLIGQVAADLIAAGVLETTPGRAALALAVRIESPMETGSAAATMTRELTRLMDAAAALAPASQDTIDGLGDSVGAKLKLVT